MSPRASDVYTLRLQVGRWLRGPMLTLAVFVRELPSRLVDGFDSMYGAPQWVVVERSDDVGGSWRVSAGREYGAGTHLLGVMRADAETMTPEAFDAQWHRR